MWRIFQSRNSLSNFKYAILIIRSRLGVGGQVYMSCIRASDVKQNTSLGNIVKGKGKGKGMVYVKAGSP